MDRSQLPWLSAGEPHGTAVQLGERLLRAALEYADVDSLLHQELAEIATEFSVQWASVLQRDENWESIAQCGRLPFDEPPLGLLDEVLERGEAAFRVTDDEHGWSIMAAPLRTDQLSDCVIVFAGRNLTADELPAVVLVTGVLQWCLRVTEDRQRMRQRSDRFQNTLRLAASFAKERKSGRLLDVIADEATQLLECAQAHIFVWDRERKELIAYPAPPGGETLRVKDSFGLVGEVVQSGKVVRIDDTTRDSRFHPQVDLRGDDDVHTLLCVPMQDAEGRTIGAFECVNKHDDVFTDEDAEGLRQLAGHAATAIRNTQEWEQLIRSREQLIEQVRDDTQIIGKNPAIVALRSTVERLAATELPVLIHGENGTGKEIVAQALHYQGPRSANPFIAVNCAAFSESRLVGELFGLEKGSFTEPEESRHGRMELADGGTFFLDEIDALSPDGQAKLMQVLEQRTFTREGGTTPIPIDVRIVAATNLNLADSVAKRSFREDLYYRLSVVTQVMPPLRDRPEDILLLTEHFLQRFCRQARRQPLTLSPEARRRLQAHTWPGNIRELRNLMERVAFLSPSERVEAETLVSNLAPSPQATEMPQFADNLKDATKEFQQWLIRKAIREADGNMSHAADALGLHRSNLYRKMRQLDMDEAADGDD